MADAEP